MRVSSAQEGFGLLEREDVHDRGHCGGGNGGLRDPEVGVAEWCCCWAEMAQGRDDRIFSFTCAVPQTGEGAKEEKGCSGFEVHCADCGIGRGRE